MSSAPSILTLSGRRATPVLLSLLVGLLTAACGGGHAPSGEAEARAPVAVELATAGEDAWSFTEEVTASVLPLVRATPGTVLMGRVESVLVAEGDRVREGQPLARIDSRDVDARVAQARAGVAAAAAMERNAKRMLERMERLHARNAASERDLEDAQAGHEAARAALEAAEEAVKVAEMYLDYSEVTAPFAGVVVEKRIEAGDMASPGMPLFVIDDVRRVKIEAQVPESESSALTLGDAVEVEFQGTTLVGKLGEVMPSADPRSRTVTVRVMLDNPEGRLRPGMFARLRLGGGSRPVVSVPAEALVRRGPLTGLFVAEASQGGTVAALRWITVGRQRDGRFEVLTGLAAGERYVLRPEAGLEDGRPIEVTR